MNKLEMIQAAAKKANEEGTIKINDQCSIIVTPNYGPGGTDIALCKSGLLHFTKDEAVKIAKTILILTQEFEVQ